VIRVKRGKSYYVSVALFCSVTAIKLDETSFRKSSIFEGVELVKNLFYGAV
jgi:hypothetical protein